MKKHLFAALFLFSLAACSTLKAKDYDRGPAATEDELERGGAACEMAAKDHARFAGWAVYNEQYNDMYDSCMRSKGFKRIEK